MLFRNMLSVGLFVAMVATSSVAQSQIGAKTHRQSEGATSIYYNWTGFYAGGNAGVALLGTTASTGLPGAFPDRDDITMTGLTGGLQLGFNWQALRNGVLGAELDYNFMNLSRVICLLQNCTGGANQFDLTSAANSIVTLRGRFGYTFDRSMLYGTFGVARVRSTDEWSNFSNTPRVINSETRTGFTLGAGLETALSENWSTKTEYIFVDTGTSRVFDPRAAGSYVDFKHQYHLTRVGLNYRFGQASPGDMSAAVTAPTYDWTGWYFGNNFGGSTTNTKFEVPNNTVAGVTDSVDLYGRGWISGFQAGYNWSIGPSWIVGVEGDVSVLLLGRTFTSINTQTAGLNNILATKTDWFTSLRGRVGYTLGRSMFYATGGAAGAYIEDYWTSGFAFSGSTSKGKLGWAGGYGVEVAVTDAWRAKLEYLYIDAGKVSVSIPGVANQSTFDHTYHVARMGLNYGFASR